MKTLKNTIDLFESFAIGKDEMNYLKGGGEPKDLIVPPVDDEKTK